MNQESFIVRCAYCGAKNRIPGSRMKDRAVCGKCKNPLTPVDGYPEHPVDVSDGTFQREVLGFHGPVAVFFWAPWCGYCRRMTPVFDELASEYAGRLKFAKFVTEQNPAVSSQYNIQSVPTLILFKGGRQINRLTGALPKEQLEYHLKSLL